MLRIIKPCAAGLARLRVAWHLVQENNTVCMINDGRWRRAHRLFQIGHDQIDPGSERFRLACLQSFGKTINVRVAMGRVQKRAFREGPDTHHGRVGKVTKSFQVICAFLRVCGNL